METTFEPKKNVRYVLRKFSIYYKTAKDMTEVDNIRVYLRTET